jgi:Antidote-toxin recognition MazE, bacterial antitoxin
MQELQDSAKHSVNRDISTTVLRRVQAYPGDKSLTIVIPKTFVQGLEIQKGDYLSVRAEGKQIVLEKIEF